MDRILNKDVWRTNAPLPGELYQYVVAAVYHADGIWGDATFDLYMRDLPAAHGFVVTAGLEPVLDALQNFKIGEAEAERLKKSSAFAHIKPSFFEYLKRLSFQGDVWAMPEGSVVFPGEPLLRVTAPLPMCSLLETLVVQLMSASTGVATAAARLCLAAGGRPVMEFGSRRWPDPVAGVLAARAAYIGGTSATSNAEAAMRTGIPVMGTMPDTFLAAYGDDPLAIRAFRQYFPGLCHLSLSEPDMESALDRFKAFAKEVQSVRVDLDKEAQRAVQLRAALDRRGMKQTRILGSGDLDVTAIERLVANKAPVDWFAVGRALSSAMEHGPKLAFRIAEQSRGPDALPVTRPGSARWPGRKQVFRFVDRDVVGLEDEAWEWERLGGKAMLQPVIREGERVGGPPSFTEMRQYRAAQIQALPASLRDLKQPGQWPVEISPRLSMLDGRCAP